MTTAIVVFLVGGFADFWTTRIGLANGFREGNPMLRWVLNRLPFDSEVELAGVKVAVLALFLYMGVPPLVLYITGALQLVAAWHNYRLLKKKGIV